MGIRGWRHSLALLVTVATLVTHVACDYDNSPRPCQSAAAAPGTKEVVATDPAKAMKEIEKALRTYAEAKKTFPPAYSTGKDGKPLLSWRVLILPYLESGEGLYRQFHLDEPWDSEWNKKLIAQMPSVYRHKESKVAAGGKTNFLTVRGAETLFPGKDGIALADVARNASTVIMTVEVSDARAVVWSKPDDFVYNDENPWDGLIGFRSFGCLVGFADGTVVFLDNRSGTDAAGLRIMFTRFAEDVER